MFFQKKNDRAMNWLKEQNEKELDKRKDEASYSPEETESTEESGDTKEQSQETWKEDTIKDVLESREKKKKGMDLEKHDMTALMVSAFLVFVPIAILILGLFALISWLFF